MACAAPPSRGLRMLFLVERGVSVVAFYRRIREGAPPCLIVNIKLPI